MSTYRDVVSRVRSTNKLLGADALITDRMIVAELRGKATSFLIQEINRRRLWDTGTIFTTIPCLEMIQVPFSECCEYTSDLLISRSKHKIPRISEGLFGLLIQGVYNVEGNMKLKEVTLSRFINIQKLGLKTKETYYWVTDEYIWVSSSHVKAIRPVAHFEVDIPDEIMFPECDACTSLPKKDPCEHPLDREFKYPKKIEDIAVAAVSQTLLSTYFKIRVDHTSDNKDNQTNPV